VDLIISETIPIAKSPSDWGRGQKGRTTKKLVQVFDALPLYVTFDCVFPARLVKKPIINTVSAGYDNILLSILNDRLEGFRMKTLKFTYWKDVDFYLGYLNDYPDYQTQGMSKEELVANLKDLLVDLESGEVPYVRKVEELVVVE
jgi:hypothetical protein